MTFETRQALNMLKRNREAVKRYCALVAHGQVEPEYHVLSQEYFFLQKMMPRPNAKSVTLEQMSGEPIVAYHKNQMLPVFSNASPIISLDDSED